MEKQRHYSPGIINPWRRQVLGVWFVAAAVGVLGLILVPFQQQAATLAFVLGGIVGLVAFLAEGYVLSAGRRLAAFRRGEYLAHWTYEPAEWERFRHSPYAPKRKGPAQVPAVGAGTGFCYGMVLFGWLGNHLWPKVPEDDPRVFLVILFFAGGSGIGTVLGYGLGKWLTVIGSLGRAPAPPGEAYIGSGALYFDGQFESWSAFGLYLSDVSLKEDNPPVLEFFLNDIDDNSRLVCIPVPEGREEEARQIVGQLKRK